MSYKLLVLDPFWKQTQSGTGGHCMQLHKNRSDTSLLFTTACICQVFYLSQSKSDRVAPQKPFLRTNDLKLLYVTHRIWIFEGRNLPDWLLSINVSLETILTPLLLEHRLTLYHLYQHAKKASQMEWHCNFLIVFTWHWFKVGNKSDSASWSYRYQSLYGSQLRQTRHYPARLFWNPVFLLHQP